MEKLAERMSDIMRQKKISAAELARRIGTDRSTIGHYLRGDYLPKYDKIQKIADSLGVSVSYITGMTDDPAPTGDTGLDGFLDNFIRSTQPGSFGPVTVSIDDVKLIAAYHEADPPIQSAVRKLLDLPEL